MAAPAVAVTLKCTRDASHIILADSDDVAEATRDIMLIPEDILQFAVLGNGAMSAATIADVAALIAPLSRLCAATRFEWLINLAKTVCKRNFANWSRGDPNLAGADANLALLNAHVIFSRLRGDALHMIVWVVLNESLRHCVIHISDEIAIVKYANKSESVGYRDALIDLTERGIVQQWMVFMRRFVSPLLKAYDGPAPFFTELQIGPYRDRFVPRHISHLFPEWISPPWTHVAMHSFCVAAQHFRTKKVNSDGSVTHATLGYFQTLWDAEVQRIRDQRMETALACARQALEHTTMSSDVAYLMGSYLDDELRPPPATKRKAPAESKEEEQEEQTQRRPHL